MDQESIVYVVDDDAAARQAVVELVRSNGLPAKEFASADEFLAHYSPIMQGCIVMDVRMAEMAGLAMLQQLRSPKGMLPVVVVTTKADIPLAVSAMREGAVAFLEKSGRNDELWNAIQQALEVEQSQYS